MSEILLDHSFSPDCGCPACAGFEFDDASLDPLAGGTANAKPIWTAEKIAEYLNRTGGGFADGFGNDLFNGIQNNIGDDNSVITFGFFNTQSQLVTNGYIYTANNAQGVPTTYGLSEYFQFGAFSEAQRAATRDAIGFWDDVVAVSFREASADEADMNFGNLTNSPNTQAYARIPTAGLDSTLGGQVREIGGDVWVSASQASNFQFGPNGYGMNTLTHEIGHAIGLSHPGAYNFGPGFSVTYGNGAEYAQDARNYSIMSYWNPRDVGSTASGVPTRDFNWSLMALAYGATPMIHDILAAQKMYGVDTTTRTGDTTYGFNSNAGKDVFDFTKNAWPTMTIWDAGGEDTLDASGYAVEQRIDLNQGALSSIGGWTLDQFLANGSFEQTNAARLAAGYTPVSQATYDANKAAFLADPEWRGRLTDNVGIAYGAVVENAKGGSGKDTIIGNAVDNKLFGNAGNDVLLGNGGNDALDGGLGNDALDGGIGDDSMSGGLGDDSYVVDSAGDTVTEAAGEGTDTVRSAVDHALSANVENLVLTGTAVSGTGNELGNVLTGNARANQVFGGAGDDRLVGGDGRDFLRGGTGSDTFVAENNATKVTAKSGQLSTDTIVDFVSGTDKIDLGALGLTAAGFTGTDSARQVGQYNAKSYASVTGAENALGFDIDGIDGPSTFAGPVTVLFLNLEGTAAPEVAIALLGTSGVSAGDFVFG